ncbi:MAG TPA: DNA methyltransferase, partial [Candidatus Hydrogenedentes bacterium]|nr:DNA methyltransferase [Candidatus Hydrogenedentota bacterium]
CALLDRHKRCYTSRPAFTEIKAQAQSGQMAEQLYAVVYKEAQITGYTKAGNPKVKKVRGFRAPRPEDDVREQVQAALDAKLPEWQAKNIIPDEEVIDGNKTNEPIRYGMRFWRDMFSPRQLYGHCTSVEVFHELVEELGGPANLSELDKAALTYLAIAMDKVLNYNANMVRWHANREVVAGVFDRHDFAFKWSFAEMAPTITGVGYDWAIRQTGKSLEELIELCGGPSAPSEPDLFNLESHGMGADSDQAPSTLDPSTIVITNGSGDSLAHVLDQTVDAVVMDPPYYDNVMYAELADFFYVWLKRTVGLFYPEQFSSYLTDKDREAVANTAKFKDFTQVKGTGGAKKRASRDYQERMQAIFAECRRVLKPDGVMVLMFTHKATGAWDALARGLLDAGFMITASWPINTEAEGSLHIKDKNAARARFSWCAVRGKRKRPPAKSPIGKTWNPKSWNSSVARMGTRARWRSSKSMVSGAWTYTSRVLARRFRCFRNTGPCSVAARCNGLNLLKGPS